MIDDEDFGSEWCLIIDGEKVSESIETLAIVHHHPVVAQGFAIWIRRAKWDLSNIATCISGCDLTNPHSMALVDIKVLAGASESEVEQVKSAITLIATKSEIKKHYRKITCKLAGILSPNSDYATFRTAVTWPHKETFIDPHLQSEFDTLRQSSGFSLTARQIEIVRLVADGKSSKQIASQLGLRPKTVENHRAEIMRRMGVACAAEMISKANQAGVLDDKST